MDWALKTFVALWKTLSLLGAASYLRMDSLFTPPITYPGNDIYTSPYNTARTI